MIYLFIILGLILLVIIISSFNVLKEKLWDKPRKINNELERKLEYEKEKNIQLEQKLTTYRQYEKYINAFELNEAAGKSEDLLNRLEEISNLICDPKEYKRARKLLEYQEKVFVLEEELRFYKSSKSNLTAIPYMAQLVADYETIELEKLACKLDWGANQERAKKVASIRELRYKTKMQIEECEEAKYQLAYLLQLFPNLQDIIDTEFHDLPSTSFDDLPEHDSVKDYLSKDEYISLSESERNQLALNRYIISHRKTKWQIGRDYENYIGYEYSQLGYSVDYYGSRMGLMDLGRDLICTKDGKTLIIQCKYWSQNKQIHENHITQLFGTVTSYCIENNIAKRDIKGILVTNITLSAMAKKIADYLRISYVEDFGMGEYPMIKCNINNKNEKIYHLPFDQQYDNTVINKQGEFLAFTVAEAEERGFRRAYKWNGT